MVLNIINGNFGLVKSWQKSPRPIGVSVLFVPFWSHSKPYTRAQLERPKRLAQSDNQLQGEKHTKFRKNMKWFVYECWTLSNFLSWANSYNWLRDHTSWALVELEWRLKVFPSTSNLCFEIHHTKVHSLVIFWSLHSICYQLRMK